MGALGTLLLYAVVGIAVAIATILRAGRRSAPAQWAHAAGAFVFWPVFLPFVFARPPPPVAQARSRSRYDPRIRAGEARLEAALAALDGVAEHLLAPQRERLRVLGDGLRAMASRAEEMERLLATPEFDHRRATEALTAAGEDDVRAASIRARLRNIDRLDKMRHDTIEELERALLRVEEIGSQMVLLKFVEDPDREALRLLEELASTVEGATEGLTA